MTKRLLAVITAAFLLCTSLATLAAPIASAAGQGACVDNESNPQQYFEAAQQFTTNSTYVDAVRGLLDTTGFWRCDSPDSNDIYGMSVWVSLSPETFFNEWSIIQIGAVACDTGDDPAQGPFDVCYNHPNQVRYFWAHGGCLVNGQIMNPYPQDVADQFGIAPVSGNSHEYRVTSESDRFEMWIDGVNVFDVNKAGDTWTNCWNGASGGGQFRGQWAAEFWNPGDSFGLSPNNSHLGAAQISNASQSTWQNTAWNSSGSCNAASDNPPTPPSVSQHCDPLSVNSFRAYNTIP